MKYIWEVSDIQSGRRFAQAHPSGEEFIIGYDPSGDLCPKEKCIVSLSDGSIVRKDKTVEYLADYLTKGNYRPLDLR